MIEQTPTEKLDILLINAGLRSDLRKIKGICKEAGLKFVEYKPGIPSHLPQIKEIDVH